ncbi:hypothetical protein BDF19DRAFT_462799 [Syncephalis fuscata]|nr:hypothetical protein BDF19DRAFT_462799 [Syncephalis fuscata]
MCVAATSFADAWGPVAHDAIAFMVKDLLSDGVPANWADTIRNIPAYAGGANGVLALWYGKTSTNLHAVWDSFLPKTVMNNDPETFAKKLSPT